MPKVESIMWERRILIGPFSEAIGLIPTDEEVICNAGQYESAITIQDKGVIIACPMSMLVPTQLLLEDSPIFCKLHISNLREI